MLPDKGWLHTVVNIQVIHWANRNHDIRKQVKKTSYHLPSGSTVTITGVEMKTVAR